MFLLGTACTTAGLVAVDGRGVSLPSLEPNGVLLVGSYGLTAVVAFVRVDFLAFHFPHASFLHSWSPQLAHYAKTPGCASAFRSSWLFFLMRPSHEHLSFP